MSMNDPEQQGVRSTLASKIGTLVNHPAFSNTVIALILFNAVIVGLETYPGVYLPYQEWFHFADRLLLWVFTVEIILRLISTKPFIHYFKSSWNLFDFFIVVSGHLFAGAHFITVLRILRVLRVLRAISVIPSLRRIVNALLMTIPALGNITLLMGILFYIFAVMGTMLFSHHAPEYFGSLHLSLLTLFQVVTLESWASGVMRPLLVDAPWAWVYFVAFILVGTFVIFNLFVGVIVSNVEKVDLLEAEMEKEKSRDIEGNSAEANKSDPAEGELGALRQEVRELKELIIGLRDNKR
jgi:voltage-gated sodium channel